MLSAIDFDDDLSVRAQEVHDVSVDRYLSLEFPSAKPAISQAKPQDPLGICLITTQAPCDVDVSFHHSDPLTPTLSPPGRGSAPKAGSAPPVAENRATVSAGNPGWGM